MSCHVDLQVNSTAPDIPALEQLERWVKAALQTRPNDSEVSICIVDCDMSQALNARYRKQDKPTNVLSFPADLLPELNLPLLGELVICAPVIAQEAAEQNKMLEAHWAHMVVHGTLHLLGYDHIKDSEAESMEQLETHIINTLGYPPPYREGSANLNPAQE